MFLLIVSAIFGVIVAIALASIKFIFSEHIAKKFYRLFALADLAVLVVLVGGFMLRSFVPEFFIVLFGNVATVFIMAQLIGGVLVMGAVVVRWIYRKFNKPKPFDPARRKALIHGMIYPALSLAVSLYGNRVERNRDVENFYDVPI